MRNESKDIARVDELMGTMDAYYAEYTERKAPLDAEFERRRAELDAEYQEKLFELEAEFVTRTEAEKKALDSLFRSYGTCDGCAHYVEGYYDTFLGEWTDSECRADACPYRCRILSEPIRKNYENFLPMLDVFLSYWRAYWENKTKEYEKRS